MEISWSTGDKPRTIRILGGKPKHLEEFSDIAGAMGEGDEVNLSFSFDYVDLKARRALVRLAYLALFHHFGYQYVLSGAGACVRKLLNNGDIGALRCLTPRLDEIKGEWIKRPIVICRIPDGQLTIAYLVLIRTETLKERHHAVLLPGAAIPEANALNVLANIGARLHGNRLMIQGHD